MPQAAFTRSITSGLSGSPALMSSLMRTGQADFTLTFRRLTLAAGSGADESSLQPALRELFTASSDLDGWLRDWRQRLASDPQTVAQRVAGMRAANPAFIPRNHRVEQALNAAIEYGDFSLFAEMLTVLSRPYEDQAAFAGYADAPQADERVFRTFCGT